MRSKVLEIISWFPNGLTIYDIQRYVWISRPQLMNILYDLQEDDIIERIHKNGHDDLWKIDG